MNELNSISLSGVKLKVCGMKYSENISEIASLNPDYLGFIFYGKSPRNFEGEITDIPSAIKKTGVFVDAPLEFILGKIRKYNFRAIQLHGDESASFCEEIKLELAKEEKTSAIEIIKVFSIKEEFDFRILKEFEKSVDYFLFDTKGRNKGGNGETFDWEILKNYPSRIPFFLSGGIGTDEIESIKELYSYFEKQGKQHLLYSVDVNSRFEATPGFKNVEMLRKFSRELKSEQ
jgi:phosphoribosylanthranilate isomerase